MKGSTIRVAQMFVLALALIFVSISARADDAATLYKAKCAVCHSADGSGTSEMGKGLGSPDLRSDATQKETDAQLTDSITNGKGKKMPAYKGKLTDDQIKDLVAYIRDLAKKK